MRPFEPLETAKRGDHKPVMTLWIYAIAVGGESRKTTQSAVGGEELRGVCVQLYEQEGSLCVESGSGLSVPLLCNYSSKITIINFSYEMTLC